MYSPSKSAQFLLLNLVHVVGLYFKSSKIVQKAMVSPCKRRYECDNVFGTKVEVLILGNTTMSLSRRSSEYNSKLS